MNANDAWLVGYSDSLNEATGRSEEFVFRYPKIYVFLVLILLPFYPLMVLTDCLPDPRYHVSGWFALFAYLFLLALMVAAILTYEIRANDKEIHFCHYIIVDETIMVSQVKAVYVEYFLNKSGEFIEREVNLSFLLQDGEVITKNNFRESFVRPFINYLQHRFLNQLEVGQHSPSQFRSSQFARLQRASFQSA
jgi:hypothetical protein